MTHSKRHPRKFYLTLIFATTFFIFMGTIMLFAFYDKYSTGIYEQKLFMLPIFAVAVFCLAIYSVIRYWNSAPYVEIQNTFIKIGREKIYFQDIALYALSGKFPFKYVLKFPFEGWEIVKKNGDVIHLFNDFYLNTPELKLSFEKNFLNKEPHKTKQDISPNKLRFDDFETFAGIQWISLRGVTLWGMIVFFAGLIIYKGKQPSTTTILVMSTICIIWFWLNSYFMHYFKLYDQYLVVKNHNWIWRTHIYHINDIKEVAFETQGKWPNCLRIITKDHKNQLYPAGTLWDKTWFHFKDKLEEKNILVRNECIY